MQANTVLIRKQSQRLDVYSDMIWSKNFQALCQNMSPETRFSNFPLIESFKPSSGPELKQLRKIKPHKSNAYFSYSNNQYNSITGQNQTVKGGPANTL